VITALPRIAIAVEDFDQAMSFFRDQLGLAVADISVSSAADLGAKIAVCVPEGGSNIEIMSPCDPEKPLSQSLSRFLGRRGEGLFALMLESPDPNAEADDLTKAGLKVMPLMPGAGGRDIHPNSTHGVLIRIYPENSFDRQEPKTKLDIGITGIISVGVAVQNLDGATAIYSDQLDMRALESRHDGEPGITSRGLQPLKGACVDLFTLDGSMLGEGLNQNGEGMKRLTLSAPDLSACYRALIDRKVEARLENDRIVIGSPFLGGARLEIVSRQGF